MSTSILGDLSDFLSEIKTDFYDSHTAYPVDVSMSDIHMRIIATDTKKDTEENDYCVAMVRNIVNGEQQKPYQCTRKKKHGHYCGLHAGKQTQFTHISDYRKEKREIFYLKLSDVASA